MEFVNLCLRGDGGADLAVANCYDHNVSLLLKLSGPRALLGDLNGDGRVDGFGSGAFVELLTSG